MLEHLILICNLNELGIILSLLICNESKVRVTFFAVFTNDERIVQRVFFEEFLWIVVAVNVNLGQSIVNSRVLRTGI